MAALSKSLDLLPPAPPTTRLKTGRTTQVFATQGGTHRSRVSPRHPEKKKRTRPPPKEDLLGNYSGLKEKLSRSVVDTKSPRKPRKPYLPPKSFLCGPQCLRQRKVLHWSRLVYAFSFPDTIGFLSAPLSHKSQHLSVTRAELPSFRHFQDRLLPNDRQKWEERRLLFRRVSVSDVPRSPRTI